MKIRLHIMAIIASLVLVGNAWAQSITIPTTTVTKGNTATVNLAFTAGGEATNLDFSISYDETIVDETTAAINCSNTIPELTALNCSVDTTNNTIKGIGVNFSSSTLSSTDPFAVMTLPVFVGANVGDSVNAFIANFFDVSGTSVGQQNGTWTLRVTDGPQAAYSDALSPNPLALATAEEGDANPTGTVTVTNTGDPSTTLTGTCSYSGDTAMSLSSGAFSLAQNASKVVTLTCNSSAEGSYSGTVSCTHNANNTPSPVEHDATCVVGPPGDAKYTSVPTPGTPVNLTDPVSPAIVGSVIPDQELVITNNPLEANDNDLALINCGLTGGASAISATAVTTPLAPFASTTVTFSCDSSVVGNYSDTYSCSYDENGDATPDGTATHVVNCSVRNPESEVVESPISGTPLTIVVPIGGTGQALVTFKEILGEGEDGTLDDCSFDDVTYHRIVTPTSYPQVISSDGSVVVVVEGMGTEDGLPTTATLSCSYTDSDNEATPVSWRVDVYVQALEIPTLSAWGLALMMLILLGLGGFVIRRQALS